MKSILLCQFCQKDGLKSSITYKQNIENKRAEEFYDENGKLHLHDGPRHVYIYRCSQGHTWEEIETNPCWCQQ